MSAELFLALYLAGAIVSLRPIHRLMLQFAAWSNQDSAFTAEDRVAAVLMALMLSPFWPLFAFAWAFAHFFNALVAIVEWKDARK